MIMLEMNQDVTFKTDVVFEHLVDSLLSVLKKEVEVYQELRTTIQDEWCLLRKPSLESISLSNNKKETCILKARMLEEVRVNVVKKIARNLGKNDNEINVSTLSGYTNNRQTDELRELQMTLLPLMEAIKEANRVNQGLLDYSLSYMRKSANFIDNLLSVGSGYAHTGKLHTNGTNGRLLSREG